MVSSSCYITKYIHICNDDNNNIDIPKCKTVKLPDALKYVMKSSLSISSNEYHIENEE